MTKLMGLFHTVRHTRRSGGLGSKEHRAGHTFTLETFETRLLFSADLAGAMQAPQVEAPQGAAVVDVVEQNVQEDKACGCGTARRAAAAPEVLSPATSLLAPEAPTAGMVTTPLVAPAPGTGRVLYVASTGHDRNAGTEAAPFATLQGAMDAGLKAGDTVLVRAGTYAGFKARYTLEGRVEAPITIRPFEGEHVVIDHALSRNPNMEHVITFNAGARHLIFEGFEITDSRTTPPPDMCTKVNAIKIYCPDFAHGSSQVCTDWAGPYTFRNLHIHGVRGTAILGHGNDIQIVNNHIHHNGRFPDGRTMGVEAYGTYVSGSRALIQGNLIHHNAGNGIRAGNIINESYFLNDSIIENNIVHNNRLYHGCFQGRMTDDFGAFGIVIYGGRRNIVQNNLVYGDHYGSFRVDGYDNLIYHNTMTGSSHEGITSRLGRNTFVNNIFYRESFLMTSSGNVSHNNLFDDPRWVDPSRGDFRLQAGSPAIKAGYPLGSSVVTDILGVRRMSDAAPDIGAFAFHG